MWKKKLYLVIVIVNRTIEGGIKLFSTKIKLASKCHHLYSRIADLERKIDPLDKSYIQNIISVEL